MFLVLNWIFLICTNWYLLFKGFPLNLLKIFYGDNATVMLPTWCHISNFWNSGNFLSLVKLLFQFYYGFTKKNKLWLSCAKLRACMSWIGSVFTLIDSPVLFCMFCSVWKVWSGRFGLVSLIEVVFIFKLLFVIQVIFIFKILFLFEVIFLFEVVIIFQVFILIEIVIKF